MEQESFTSSDVPEWYGMVVTTYFTACHPLSDIECMVWQGYVCEYCTGMHPGVVISKVQTYVFVLKHSQTRQSSAKGGALLRNTRSTSLHRRNDCRCTRLNGVKGIAVGGSTAQRTPNAQEYTKSEPGRKRSQRHMSVQ